MNSEQLNSARLARWSQNGEARLTLEAAAEWLGTIGFCSYLPMGPTAVAPSASFLEAVVGRPAQIPSAGERTRANDLLARLVENSAAVPLKLGPALGEQPDFLTSPEVFRYIYALRGNRNFKADPSTVGNEKVTPLALHCWQAIKEHGPLDLPGLQSILGRDMTEAAIARGLQELWAGLYACPIASANGQPAQWEMLSRRFPQQVAAGAGTGHAESLSAMVSLYLYAVVAATEEEILAFLSPLAAQSKLREVIRGLGSMRQLDMIDVGGRAHLSLQGGLLPEMVAQLSEEQLVSTPIETGARDGGIEIERATPHALRPEYRDSGEHGKFVPKKFVPRKFVPRDSGGHASAPKRFNIHASGRRAGEERDSQFSRPRSAPGSTGRPGRFGSGTRETRNPDDRKTAARGPGERARRWEKSSERPGSSSTDRTFAPKSTFKSSGFKPAGSKPWARKGAPPRSESTKPWTSRASFGSGAPAQHGGDQEARPKRWAKPGSGSSAAPAGGRPYGTKSSGFQSGGPRPWDRKAGASGSAEAGRKERPKRWAKSAPGAEARPASRKPYAAKPSGFKSGGEKPWISRGAESRVGSARSYAARTGDKPSGPKPWAARSAKTGDEGQRPPRRDGSEGRGGAKPNEKSGAKPFWTKNPRGGKGSATASRTNRPRGGKFGGKKSGKKK